MNAAKRRIPPEKIDNKQMRLWPGQRERTRNAEMHSRELRVELVPEIEAVVVGYLSAAANRTDRDRPQLADESEMKENSSRNDYGTPLSYSM